MSDSKSKLPITDFYYSNEENALKATGIFLFTVDLIELLPSKFGGQNIAFGLTVVEGEHEGKKTLLQTAFPTEWTKSKKLVDWVLAMSTMAKKKKMEIGPNSVLGGRFKGVVVQRFHERTGARYVAVEEVFPRKWEPPIPADDYVANVQASVDERTGRVRAVPDEETQPTAKKGGKGKRRKK